MLSHALLIALLALPPPADAGGHWAWRPLRTAPAPAARAGSWARSPIDTFLLARLDGAELQPAPEASRETLLRRATLDLTGLPPTVEELDDFLEDPSPDAWERVIARLLASPRHGERWGRLWLDLARFAESNGYEHDEVRPDAWRYRDYVIRALNADKPHDRFVAEQIAGDEIAPGDPDALVATGFNLLGPDMTDAADQAQRRHNTLVDMTDTAALVFLGMTLGCARCHDHKSEPYTQADYYSLQAYFAPAAFRRDLPIALPDDRIRFEVTLAEYTRLAAPLTSAIEAIEQPVRDRLRQAKLEMLSGEARLAHRTPLAERTPIQRGLVETTERLIGVSAREVTDTLDEGAKRRRAELERELKTLDGRKPAPLPVAIGLSSPAGPTPRTHILERGQLAGQAGEVQPAPPRVLERLGPTPVPPPAAGRRAALAAWITGPASALAARVAANRVWQGHFGRGLVASASDFGTRGSPPTHPSFLERLAAELLDDGWSVKRLHWRIVTSSAYRQASLAGSAQLARDPDNALLSRQRRQRLEGEAVRDSLLAAAGLLDLRMGGPGVFPPVPAAALQGTTAWRTSPDRADHCRRSVYIFARRNLRYPFLEAFDFPDSNLSCPRRERSTTAPQALALLNAELVVEAAAALAARLEKEAGGASERVDLAFRIVLGRRPTAAEAEDAAGFLASSPLRELCRALFNASEFVYLQ